MTAVSIDPDDRRQVEEIAAYLAVAPAAVRSLLDILAERQLVDQRIESYWRGNPEPRPRSWP